MTTISKNIFDRFSINIVYSNSLCAIVWYADKFLCYILAAACDFQQCDILISVDSNEPVQPPFKHRNS